MGHLFKKKKKSWENQEGMKGKIQMSFTVELKDTVKQQQLYTTIYTTCTNIFFPKICNLNSK